MTYTDNQLKSALAKMLPETIHASSNGCFYWREYQHEILDTELLHLCHLAEHKLISLNEYVTLLEIKCGELGCVIALWEQRVVALAKVAGVEI